MKQCFWFSMTKIHCFPLQVKSEFHVKILWLDENDYAKTPKHGPFLFSWWRIKSFIEDLVLFHSFLRQTLSQVVTQLHVACDKYSSGSLYISNQTFLPPDFSQSCTVWALSCSCIYPRHRVEWLRQLCYLQSQTAELGQWWRWQRHAGSDKCPLCRQPHCHLEQSLIRLSSEWENRPVHVLTAKWINK